ncbi:hypothetical protein YC2023_116078 [Brassica napus]
MRRRASDAAESTSELGLRPSGVCKLRERERSHSLFFMEDSMANKTQSAGQKRKQPTEPSTNATDASMARPRKQYVTRSDAWQHFTKSKDDPEKLFVDTSQCMQRIQSCFCFCFCF